MSPKTLSSQQRRRSYRADPLSRLTPVLGPLFDELMQKLAAAQVPCVAPPIAYYQDSSDGDGLVVHAAAPIPEGAVPGDLTVTELPEISVAAVLHTGPMDDVMPTVQGLGRWISAHGYRSTAYNREVYLCYGEGMPEPWQTELQEPVTTV